MAPDEPTWDDTGFESGSNDHDGFMAADSGGRKRITPPEPPAPPPPPSRKDRSQRGPLFWFSVLAGVVLVLAVVGGFFYWLSQPSVEEQAFMAPETVTPAPAPRTELPRDTATEIEVASGDVVHEPEALDLLYGKDSAAASSSDRKTASSASTPPAPAVAPQPTSKPRRTLPSEPPSEKTTSVQPPPASVPSTTIAKEPAAPVKTTKAVKTQTTTAPKGTSALYVVQVFSSPSRADADEWLQLLQSKNVTDAYVTEQKIKDQTWYRVRFGSYANREQAEAEAIRLGFKEPWIARIR